MLRIQPRVIIADNPNLYLLQCTCDAKNREFRFTVENSELGYSHRVIHHEDEFYFVTYDDPEAEWLENSIHYFDNARLQERNLDGRKTQPLSLTVHAKGHSQSQQYIVVFQSNGSETSHLITVTEDKDIRIATWEYGSCLAQLRHPGLWETAIENDPLLKAALMFHQAIYPKYSHDASNKGEVNSILTLDEREH